MRHRWWFLLLFMALLLIAPLSIRFISQPAAFAVLWILPIVVWSVIMPGNIVERWLLAAAFVLMFHAFAMLWITYLPGSSWFSVVLIIPMVLRTNLNMTEAPLLPQLGGIGDRKSWLWFAAITIIIVMLRLPNLGYKEIQGDEGIALVRAADALTGVDGVLFLHQKGPMEITLPMTGWEITTETSDFWIRLPFTWASILSVFALWVLARDWFNRPVGRTAAVYMAMMGFSVAFARILQYQSLVLLWGTMSIWCAVRYTRAQKSDELRSFRWIWLSAAFLAAGLLAHYDAILAAPAVAWILISDAVQRRSLSPRHWWPAVGIGAFMLGSFYVPFALNPNFARTLSYLLNERVGTTGDGSLAGGSSADVWRMLTLYNSTYYIVGITALGAAGLIWWLMSRSQKSLSDFGGLLLMAAVPAVFYLFIVSVPRTHVYTLFPGLIILASYATVQIRDILKKLDIRPLNYAFAGILSVWLIVCGGYVWLMFIDVEPERQRAWSNGGEPVRGYVTSWDELPLHGLFGFPYQAGWRAAADFLEEHPGWYASNEEQEITDWYTGQGDRTHCPTFDYFILAENVQDEVPYDPAMLETLSPIAEISVRGRPTMKIYSRSPFEGPVTEIEADGAQRWLSYRDVAQPLSRGPFDKNISLGDKVALVGYDLDSQDASPGGLIILTLYWKAIEPFDRNFQTFVHLVDEESGELRGQHDGAPDCDFYPTTRWESGQMIPDTHIVPISPDAVAGRPLAVRVGMYDLLTLERLSVSDDPTDSVRLFQLPLK